MCTLSGLPLELFSSIINYLNEDPTLVSLAYTSKGIRSHVAPKLESVPRNRFCSLCCGAGYLSLLAWSKESFSLLPWSTHCCVQACKGGHLELLKWILDNDCDWDPSALGEAAQRGHKHVIEWAKKEKYWLRKLEHAYSVLAVESGDLDFVKWMAELVGIPPGILHSKAAARAGKLDILRWLVEECHVPVEPVHFGNAASRGHLYVLNWLADNYGHRVLDWKSVICYRATDYENIHVLKWALEKKCPWDPRVCNRLAYFGNLDALKWVREAGCPWDTECAIMAVSKGQLEFVKWVVENGAPVDPYVMSAATSSGNFEILKYLRSINCEWNSENLSEALRSEEVTIEILEWMVGDGCPTDSLVDDLHCAVGSNKLEVLKWAREHGGNLTEEVFAAAATTGNMEVLCWLKEEGCPWGDQAMTNGTHSLDVLRWLRSHKCPWSSKTTSRAARWGNYESLKWLRAEGAPWSEEVASALVENRAWGTLKWALENGCPKNSDILRKASETGGPNVAAWVSSFLSNK